ncbi:MAG: serine protease [Candidatus Dormibacteria bacterium]
MRRPWDVRSARPARRGREGRPSAPGAPGRAGAGRPPGGPPGRRRRAGCRCCPHPAGTQILGTGIILSASGLVLTDYHVIRDQVFVGVRVGGTGAVHPATVVLTDPDEDLALLRIQGTPALRPAELARTSSAEVGAPVLAIGNAMGLGRVPRAAAGRLVGLHRTIRYGVGSGIVDLEGVLEAAAPIFAGDSGGALVDAAGQVIGLIAAGSDDAPCAPTAVCALHLAYAIPIRTALAQIGYTGL